MNNYKRLIVVLSALLLVFITGCSSNKTSAVTTTTQKPGINYYDDYMESPLKDLDLGGANELSLSSTDKTITIENENIRIIVSKDDGSIKELANKKAKLYLVKDGSSHPFAYFYIDSTDSLYEYEEFSYDIKEDSTSEKKLSLSWKINSKTTVNGSISLKKNDDNVTFNVSITGNDTNHSLWFVEYPLIENIDTLYNKDTDYISHPFAMGALFNNPVDNFNRSDYKGITRSQGMYPLGWDSPMQFFSYYSKGIGGFMFMTDDTNYVIKSFTIIGQNSKLRASICHYLDDIGEEDISFDYNTTIKNLTKCSWEESADIYKEWAINQPWCSKGKIETRDDVDQSFYLDTVECNFDYPFESIYGTNNLKDLYQKQKENFNGKILTIYIIDDEIVDLAKEYGDYSMQFEFPHFHNVSSAEDRPVEWYSKVTNRYNETNYYDVEGIMKFFECPSCEEYRERFLNVEKEHYVKNKVSGYYHDVGIGAGIQPYCFNTDHPHGTKINVLHEYIDQIREIKEYGISKGAMIYGQELCSEIMLPYVDFFQARANASVMGIWEIERIRVLLEDGVASVIPLFDYVYREYGAKRIDGLLYADELLGDGYYHNAALTVLNGGIPEYNFEFVKNGNYISPEEQSAEMMSFIGYLGSVKTGFGQKYLTYGAMKKAPDVGAGTIEYDFIQQRWTREDEGGIVVQNKVITSAYEYNGKIAVFLCNHTKKNLTVNFVLNALRDYSVNSSEIYLVTDNGREKLTDIVNGKANISLLLESRKVYMLEFSK